MTPEYLSTYTIASFCHQIENINLRYKQDAQLLFDELATSSNIIERKARLEPYRCNECYELHLFKTHAPSYHYLEKHNKEYFQ